MHSIIRSMQMNACKQSTDALADFETFKGTPNRTGRICGWIPPSVRSRDILIRAGLLFGALCLIKSWMLILFAENLYQIHWRVAAEPLTWSSEVAYFVFVALVVLSIWKLGTRCMVVGTRAVRTANACVLLVAAAFILLTLHTGPQDYNYIYPVLKGYLGWKDLRWYLNLDLFFRSPYVSFWLLGYAAVYFLMARSGREKHTLSLTSLCAGAYLLLCLRDLASYREALIVADCVGVVCLLASRIRGSLNVLWASLPVALIVLLWLLFSRFESRLTPTDWNAEVLLMVSAAVVVFVGATIWARNVGFYGAWSWFLPFAFVAFLLLTNTHYPVAINYRHLFCLGLVLPRYFLGELIVALIMLALGLGYRRWRPHGSLWWLDILNLAIIAYGLADLRLSQIMGVRLDWNALSLAFGETPKMMWRMSAPYLPLLGAILCMVVFLYAGLLRLSPRHGLFSEHPTVSHGLRFAALGFVVLSLAGNRLGEQDKVDGQSILVLAKTSPLGRMAASPAMDQEVFEQKASHLGMEQVMVPQAPPRRDPRELNVVVIFQESSYNKYLSLFDGKEETQPLLAKYKDRMELFPNFFSNFAGSINSRFAAFTGLYPVQDYKAFTLQRVPVKSIFEVLKDHGYACSMYYSSFFDYTSFRDFLCGRGIDQMFDADNMPGERKTEPVSWGLREVETLHAIQQRIRDYAQEKKKFFLTYIPAAPHLPFDGTPTKFRKFPAGPMGDYTAAYMNELLYMDWVISSIIDQLRDSGLLDRTLVVITDDHGEMVGENGGPIGHGWKLTPELANIPLIIMDPASHGCRTNYVVGSQVDLFPTILDLLGISAPPDQLYQGTSLYSTAAATARTIYLDSFDDYGIITQNRLLFGSRDADRRGGNDFRSCYGLANQGLCTEFSPTNRPSQMPPPISQFEEFQENFLLHYSRYCELRRPRTLAGR